MMRALLIATVLLGSSVLLGSDDALHEVTIKNAEVAAVVRFELKEPAYVEPLALFAPEALGKLAFTIGDNSDRLIDPIRQSVVLPAGKYHLLVSSEKASPEPFWVRIRTARPLDPFEPNDTRETAAKVQVPCRHRIVLQRSAMNGDWLRFSIKEEAILAVHFSDRGQAEIAFRVEDAAGKVLYQSADKWDSDGARYMKVKPGEYFLYAELTSGPSWIPIELALSLYDAKGTAVKDGGIIALGFEDDSRDLAQLKLIADTAGLAFTNTIESEEMERELVRSVEEPITAPAQASTPTVEQSADGSTNGMWPVLVGLIAYILIEVYIITRRRS